MALPTARGAATVLAGLAIGLAMITVALHALATLDGHRVAGDYWLFNALVAVGVSVSGLAIAARRPANPIGWAFIAGALGNGVTGAGSEAALLAPSSVGYWLLLWPWVLLPLAIGVTLHTFPDGRPLTRPAGGRR